MKTASPNKKRVVCALLTALTLLLCLFSLCACDGRENIEIADARYDLRLVGYSYDGQGDVMTAIVSFGGTEGELSAEPAKGTSTLDKSDPFYNVRIIEVSLDVPSIYSAITSGITQENRVFEGKEYSRLKVVFRYDTIYKSIKTNGEESVSGGYYRHTLALNEGDKSATFRLTQRTQNSASWYSVLASCAVAAFALALAAYLIAAHAKNKKSKRG